MGIARRIKPIIGIGMLVSLFISIFTVMIIQIPEAGIYTIITVIGIMVITFLSVYLIID